MLAFDFSSWKNVTAEQAPFATCRKTALGNYIGANYGYSTEAW